MEQNQAMENKNDERRINQDKFTANRGEFVPVTPDSLKGKKITVYEEYVEDEDEDSDA